MLLKDIRPLDLFKVPGIKDKVFLMYVQHQPTKYYKTTDQKYEDNLYDALIREFIPNKETYRRLTSNYLVQMPEPAYGFAYHKYETLFKNAPGWNHSQHEFQMEYGVGLYSKVQVIDSMYGRPKDIKSVVNSILAA